MDKQRTVLITGGMGGLGQSIADRMHHAGHRVIVTASPGNDNVSTWLDSRQKQGMKIAAYQVDVAQYESCRACAEKIKADIGDIDILVNNAGITRDCSLGKMRVEDWDLVIRTDLYSVFHMTRLMLEGMVRNQWGRIINISSVNGQKGQFGQANYAAAKAGMHGFTMSLAQEVAKHGVTVNTVSPGYLATRMVMSMPPETLKEKVLPQIPVGRLGKPEEVAALVVFMASDDAAFITGANYAINGGLHMQ